MSGRGEWTRPSAPPWPRVAKPTIWLTTAAAACALLGLYPAAAEADEADDFDEAFGEIEDEFPDDGSPGDDVSRDDQSGDDDSDPDARGDDPFAPEPGAEPDRADTEEAVEGSDAEPEISGGGYMPDSESFQLSGYVQPAFGVRYRPDGVPQDVWQFGADATRIGVRMTGSPIDGWFYNLHLVIGGDILSPLVDVSAVDQVGDGSPDAIDSTFQLAPGIFFEEATIGFAPADDLSVKVGQMRIPFTVEHQSPNTRLMFPQRAGPNEVFLTDTDLGALATADLGDVTTASAGVFNGTGTSPFASAEPFDPLCECNRVVRGLMYTGRLDLNPLGSFPLGVRGIEDHPLRVGMGAGLLYFPYSTFDSSGFSNTRVRDLRASASFRLAYGGLSSQVELLRRQQTDSLSDRPIIATGGYGQLSFYLPISDEFGIAPIGRWGATVEDQSFQARTTYWTEGGLTMYVHPESDDSRDEVRLTLQYLDERRVTEGENAHGMIAQLQMQW